MATTTVVATMTPASNKVGQSVMTRQFKITDIPNTMKKMQWPVAAALMNHWFSGKPWPTDGGGMDGDVKKHKAFAPEEYIEESIVKMSWVTGFERANSAMQHLRETWNSPNGVALIKRKLHLAFFGKAPGCYPVAFNGTASAAEEFGYSNSKTVKFEQVGSDEVNELRAALANFNMRVIAEGIAIVSDKGVVFTPSQLGFYIEDAYDFNDAFFFSQVLGYWSFDKLVTNPIEGAKINAELAAQKAAVMAESQYQEIRGQQSTQQKDEAARRYLELDGQRYMLVQNSDFQYYRDLHKKGGDFRVYSDIMYEAVTAAPIEVLAE